MTYYNFVFKKIRSSLILTKKRGYLRVPRMAHVVFKRQILALDLISSLLTGVRFPFVNFVLDVVDWLHHLWKAEVVVLKKGKECWASVEERRKSTLEEKVLKNKLANSSLSKYR